jgi:drug/metabolite transporter (DMT)-like permease
MTLSQLQAGGRSRALPSSLGLALVAHSGFGLYVVFVKYLLQYLAPFRMLAVAFTIALPLVLLMTYGAINWREFKRWEVWLLAALTVGRSITKLMGLQFTYAVYVQLVDMAVPLLTPIFAWFLLREKMPSGTLPAILATTLGSFFVIAVDPFQMTLPNGRDDLVGIGFAFVSAVLMTLGVVYTRHLTTCERRFRPQGLFVTQVFLVAITYWVLSNLSQENWRSFAGHGLSVWAIFGTFVLLSIVAAGLCQTVSISRTKAALFSALLSWRLVVAVLIGWLLLGERLSSTWQIVGVVVVMGTITLYLLHQSGAGRSAGRTLDLENLA